jgi:antirestriction protein ArdC
MKANDLQKEILDKIINDMESGTMPWERPWIRNGSARNASTGAYYQGINALALGIRSVNFKHNLWLTFKQAKQFGGHVKQGEKAAGHIVRPIQITKNREAEPEDQETFTMCKVYPVFNVAQCEGLEKLLAIYEKPREEFDPNELAELRIEATGASIEHGGDRACYIPDQDRIKMPERSDFKDANGYYATAFHELCHWTGHKSRLDRNLTGTFGGEAYAFEELIAELGAAMACARVGIEYSTQHASYVSSWIKALRSKKNALMKAASLAQKACNYVLQAGAKSESEAA